MKMTLRALSALLSYPSQDLQDHVSDIRSALAAERALPKAALERLETLLAWIQTQDLLDVQCAYSDLFDRSPALSLHLFEHVHGESRERGQAMISLGELYIDYGFMMVGGELPDFLPMFLEFSSCLPAGEAKQHLSEPAHVFAALEERLSERGSPYAGVFYALIAATGARPDEEALTNLRQRLDKDKSLDEEWEEKPVDFGRPISANKASANVISRIQASSGTRQPRN